MAQLSATVIPVGDEAAYREFVLELASADYATRREFDKAYIAIRKRRHLNPRKLQMAFVYRQLLVAGEVPGQDSGGNQGRGLWAQVCWPLRGPASQVEGLHMGHLP